MAIAGSLIAPVLFQQRFHAGSLLGDVQRSSETLLMPFPFDQVGGALKQFLRLVERSDYLHTVFCVHDFPSARTFRSS
jgi:hypothetical protein